MAERADYEKTCRDCKCPACDEMTAVADRVSVWKAAQSLLAGVVWPDSYDIDPRDVLILAHWLLHQDEIGDDGSH